MSSRTGLPHVVVLAADVAAWEECGLLQVCCEAEAVELPQEAATAAVQRGAVLALFRPAPAALRAATAAGAAVLAALRPEDLPSAEDIAQGSAIELLVLPASTPELVARLRLVASRHTGSAIDDRSQLRHRSRRDELTGLPGAWLYRDRLEQGLQHARRHGKPPTAAILRIGCDRRGELDSIGAARLRGIAARVRAAIRATDTVAHEGHHGAVSRGAAPELLLLLPDLGDGGPRAVLERIHAIATTEPIDLPGDVAVATIGYAEAGVATVSAEALLQQARAALEQAAPGEIRGRADATIAGSPVPGELPGTLEVWYQPIVHDRDGIVGVEALARWRHPALGLLGAAELMLYALDNGLVETVCSEVLERTAAQWRRWCDSPVGSIPVFVPLTGAELRSGVLAGAVAAAFERHDVDGAQWTFQVAEEDANSTPSAIAALQHLESRVAIDDFGAGPTAVRSLEAADSPWVKVDRALVRRLPESSDALATTRLVLSMARAVGVTVIAAGVESERQLRALRALGCEVFQGWEIGAPAPADALVTRLRRERVAGCEARVVPFRATV